MRASKTDKTQLYKLHVRSCRRDFCRHFQLKYKDCMNMEEIKEYMKEMEETRKKVAENETLLSKPKRPAPPRPRRFVQYGYATT